MIDRHPIANRAVRDVLVHYIAERSAVLDYGSLVNHAQMLADLFWGDLQRHHPAISSLHLPDDVAQAWKQRVRVRSDGRPRRTAHSVFLAVRSFYLDLSQWSMEDPARWAAWAAPCPISEADIRGYIKEARHRQARMQQRTRTLVPVLPQLVHAAETRLQHATLLLQAARAAEPGEEFTVEGSQYRRTGRNGSNWRPTALFLAPVDEPGPRFDAECEENNAFWTWASIEVLRRTGARVEELLELTHLSLRQYQAPTGETVPLLQISPSKTDRERVIPADPDLVAVLARIIRRIKGADGRVPLLTRYDGYERVFGPPMPHLFQGPSQHRLQVISPNRIRELLTDHALRAAIVDVDGTPLRFTPHDFRRIFSTETVNGGLPIHIAAKLLGHLDLNTTQAYVAVYPEEVIRHYRQFVDQRRIHRPSEEYREPSDTEWQDFRDHFSLRKVALGTCDRPYGTPCQHENAPLTEQAVGIEQFRGQMLPAVATVTGRDGRCSRAGSGDVGGSSVGPPGGDRRSVRAVSARRSRRSDRGSGRCLLPGVAGGREGAVDGPLLRDGCAPVVAVPAGSGHFLGPSDPGGGQGFQSLDPADGQAKASEVCGSAPGMGGQRAAPCDREAVSRARLRTDHRRAQRDGLTTLLRHPSRRGHRTVAQPVPAGSVPSLRPAARAPQSDGRLEARAGGALPAQHSAADPRSIPDEWFNALFAALPSHRDRAMVAFWISTGVRASELIGIRQRDVDPGQQLISVVRKGTRAVQQVPATADAFVWLRLYQQEVHSHVPRGRTQPVWWTRRHPLRPLTYHGAHRMFERVNASLGADWTLHDLRHSAAARMVRDPKLTLADVQWVLGHAHLSATVSAYNLGSPVVYG